MIRIMLFSLSWCTLSCTAPLSRAIRPPAIPFRVVFCIGVGCCIKSSMYGVTKHDAPDSTMACDVSFVHAFVEIRIVILSSSLFFKFDRFCNGKSSLSSDTASC
jgi:hypothetical protein